MPFFGRERYVFMFLGETNCACGHDGLALLTFPCAKFVSSSTQTPPSNSLNSKAAMGGGGEMMMKHICGRAEVDETRGAKMQTHWRFVQSKNC
jgi:hypothetical protein